MSPSRAGALLLLAGLAVAATAQEQRPAPGPAGETWSDEELRTLRSLWVGSLGSPPHDPSNKYAGDPRAASLGHRLFFDKRLSRNGRISCATCHDPQRHFTDGLPRSTGLGQTRRGAPTLIGVAHSPWFYWDGRRDSQWSQALAPLEAVVEMGGTRLEQVRLISSDRSYRESYEAIFGELPDLSDKRRFPKRASPVGDGEARKAWERMAEEDRTEVNRAFSNLGKAIAAYERKLVPGPSRFDRYVEHLLDGTPEESPLTAEEVAGLRLFMTHESQCLRCHNGPLLTNHGFHNIGVPQDDDDADYGRLPAIAEVLEHEFNCLGPYSDAQERQCLELNFIKKEGEELPGAFKVPTLRNVAETAPYLHSGQFESLRDLLEHYSEPKPGIGHLELAPMHFSDEEMARLELFLGTLTSEVAADPTWLAPPPVPAGPPQ